MRVLDGLPSRTLFPLPAFIYYLGRGGGDNDNNNNNDQESDGKEGRGKNLFLIRF